MNKILRYSLLVILTVVCSLSFAQTEITFTAGIEKGTFTGSGKPASGNDKITKDGITIETTNGAFAAQNYKSHAYEYRIYKNSNFTVASTVGDITKVTFTCFANGDAQYGPGNFTTVPTGEYTFESNGPTGTWTGKAATISLKPTKNQVRASKIVVTIDTTTGIKEIENRKEDANTPVYNLAGQRVGKDYKGVVIKNGKKHIQR